MSKPLIAGWLHTEINLCHTWWLLRTAVCHQDGDIGPFEFHIPSQENQWATIDKHVTIVKIPAPRGEVEAPLWNMEIGEYIRTEKWLHSDCISPPPDWHNTVSTVPFPFRSPRAYSFSSGKRGQGEHPAHSKLAACFLRSPFRSCLTGTTGDQTEMEKGVQQVLKQAALKHWQAMSLLAGHLSKDSRQ